MPQVNEFSWFNCSIFIFLFLLIFITFFSNFIFHSKFKNFNLDKMFFKYNF
uniref:ATP synthase subunit 8 n=1 Tax=Rhinotergum shaoguanense TaxID=1452699 RepID=A0A1S5XVX3_9ACAR|nr:ATP synthase F0 subunit 8 [Rhinotergum shaoguanense]AQQ72848.1 ATP synthase subunit 8 [Rhinotergum shaoguanense]